MNSRIKVWDIYIRLYHWTMVTLVFIDQFIFDDGKQVHRNLGYIIVVLILVRFIWGFITKSPYARISVFFPSISTVKEYSRTILKGTHERYIGHNPLAALMMLSILSLIMTLAVTGSLLRIEMFFGSDFMEYIHVFFAYALITCVALHVLAAITESLRSKENLVMSMIHGYKRK